MQNKTVQQCCFNIIKKTFPSPTSNLSDLMQNTTNSTATKRSSTRTCTGTHYWSRKEDTLIFDPSGPLILLDSENEEQEDKQWISRPRKVRFTICGDPVALQRPRLGLKHHEKQKKVYSPSSKLMEQFRKVVKTIVPSDAGQVIRCPASPKGNNNQIDSTSPFFPNSHLLKLNLEFYLKRPEYHFRVRGARRIKGETFQIYWQV